MEKFWKVLKTILIILLIAVIAYGVYWLVKNFKKVTDKVGDVIGGVTDTITGGEEGSGQVITDTTGKLKIGNIYIKANSDDQINAFQYFLFEVYQEVDFETPTYYSLVGNFNFDSDEYLSGINSHGYLFKSNDLQTWTNENQNDAQGVSPNYDYGIFYTKSTLLTYTCEFTTKGIYKRDLSYLAYHALKKNYEELESNGKCHFQVNEIFDVKNSSGEEVEKEVYFDVQFSRTDARPSPIEEPTIWSNTLTFTLATGFTPKIFVNDVEQPLESTMTLPFISKVKLEPLNETYSVGTFFHYYKINDETYNTKTVTFEMTSDVNVEVVMIATGYVFFHSPEITFDLLTENGETIPVDYISSKYMLKANVKDGYEITTFTNNAQAVEGNTTILDLTASSVIGCYASPKNNTQNQIFLTFETADLMLSTTDINSAQASFLIEQNGNFIEAEKVDTFQYRTYVENNSSIKLHFVTNDLITYLRIGDTIYDKEACDKLTYTTNASNFKVYSFEVTITKDLIVEMTSTIKIDIPTIPI